MGAKSSGKEGSSIFPILTIVEAANLRNAGHSVATKVCPPIREADCTKHTAYEEKG
jgi:hypothetical protein